MVRNGVGQFAFGLVLGIVLALTACGAEEEARLGQEGESCFTDTDCNQNFVCARRACVTPNQAEEAPSEVQELCEDVCAKIEECFDSPDAGCVEECAFELRDNTESQIESFDSCISPLNCSQLERSGEECFELINE